MKEVLLALLMVPLLSGCYYDNEEELYGGVVCDTTVTTYALKVNSIIEQRCFECHKASVSTSGVNLEGYANLKSYVDNGKLMGVITHSPGYPVMPQGAPKLSDCEIAIIQRWVDNGAQNN